MANSIQVLPVIEWQAPAPTQATINAKALAKPNKVPLSTLFSVLWLCVVLSAPTVSTFVFEQLNTSPSIEYRQ